jgi:hypothetical protein
MLAEFAPDSIIDNSFESTFLLITVLVSVRQLYTNNCVMYLVVAKLSHKSWRQT